MRLREIFENIYAEVQDGEEHENSLKTIGICYGRWNPPHKGHREVWKAASKNPIWYVGTNKSTSGPKDPLPYDVKIQCMAAVWPAVAGHVIPEQDLFSMCANIFQEYGSNVHLKIYTDEQWLYNAVSKYNGLKDQKHGTYNFNQIEWVKTERLANATDLRAAARSGDRDSFYHDAGIRPDTVLELNGKEVPVFDVVAHYLNQYPIKNAKGQIAEATNGQGNKMKGGTAPLDKEYKASMKNLSTMPDQNQASGSAYLNYRMGIALAGAPDYPTKMAGDTWLGGDPLLSTYTEEEMEMVKKASLQIGGGKIENWSGKRSQELPTVNKTSTTAKIKRNKYGI